MSPNEEVSGGVSRSMKCFKGKQKSIAVVTNLLENQNGKIDSDGLDKNFKDPVAGSGSTKGPRW
jgi:hypothetical protein